MISYLQYLQDGGSVQSDAQNQIVALVEAAMSGDKKAAQQIQQIMQAAQSGDQQAQQIAGMIQQVAKQLQGQAVPQADEGTKIEPRMTRADRDFAQQVENAESDYNTYTSTDGYSYESGSIRLPSHGYDIYRSITHYPNGIPSDTTYYTSQATNWDDNGEPIAWRSNNYQPTPVQRAILDKKYDYTPTSNLYKCGGKVKKGQKGLPIPTKKVAKKSQGGCPCKLAKVGGKLVEIDSCTGQIVK